MESYLTCLVIDRIIFIYFFLWAGILIVSGIPFLNPCKIHHSYGVFVSWCYEQKASLSHTFLHYSYTFQFQPSHNGY